ncbi:hypothetical protein SAMN06265795_12619 [Noviherbaspirillum humi]|uniref:DUF551 domain-containing protein n=1 Tax=Noviherbaspirillum humi TaxID=1688639 RepID=A0A239LSG2_9BURK|nr:hypothetical protein [Noviherbaspirillum humi]SNT33381.1 hypothetical protein SAMN06265795_12619 [Noviherbaspirillum humi]
MVYWHKLPDQLPDVDTTVMIYTPDANEPVWMGWFDGEIWREVGSARVYPTHWAELLEGPKE